MCHFKDPVNHNKHKIHTSLRAGQSEHEIHGQILPDVIEYG